MEANGHQMQLGELGEALVPPGQDLGDALSRIQREHGVKASVLARSLPLPPISFLSVVSQRHGPQGPDSCGQPQSPNHAL